MGRFTDWLRATEETPSPADTPRPIVKAGAPAFAFEEVANRSWNQRQVPGGDEKLAFLRGTRGLKVYSEMATTDATVGGILFVARMLMRSTDWEVAPHSSSAADVARADFLHQCLFEDMSIPWPDFVANAMDMLIFGFSAHELVFKRRLGPDNADPSKRSKYSDGLVGLRKISAIPADTVTEFLVDEAGGLRGIRQALSSGRQVEIPAEKLVLFRTDHRSWGGTSVLRTAVKAWYAKKKLEDYEAIGIERDVAGIPIIYAEPDYLLTYQTELQKIARNARNDEQAGFVLPDVRDEHGNRTVEFTVVQSGGPKSYDIDKTISRYTRDIAASISQDTLLLGHERVGSFALVKEKRDMSSVALMAWLRELAETMNTHVVPRLFRMNGWPTAELPRLVPGEIRAGDAETFARALKDATVAFPDLVPQDDYEALNEIRRRVGLPPAS